MSHQPSTAESLKNSASNAYSAVVNTVVPSSSSQNTGEDYDPNKNAANFAKDTHGNTFKKGDYKDQLNQAAHGGTKQPEKGESYVEKGMVFPLSTIR
ncbi:hypothetical protein G7Y89_g12908 [Cudoniella acicularis]|uniref:Uncharacterized protein n=1 Tax=Cudoniella acicularis TaxID=354080 RepID=A0A8H4R9I4_9HELO|nr:hypothetical protein G7Y89_g12908 [Cudoniella acicularis]